MADRRCIFAYTKSDPPKPDRTMPYISINHETDNTVSIHIRNSFGKEATLDLSLDEWAMIKEAIANG